MTVNRIYLVNNQSTGEEELVNAPNSARVLSFVSRNKFEVKVASQSDLVRLLSSGTKVQEVSAE